MSVPSIIVCGTCTLHNSSVNNVCEACENPLQRKRQRQSTVLDITSSPSDSKSIESKKSCEDISDLATETLSQCPHCTFINQRTVSVCEMCSTPIRKKQNSVIGGQTSSSSQKSSSDSTSLTASSESVTHGIISLIQQKLQVEQESCKGMDSNGVKSPSFLLEYRLCSSYCPHISQKGVVMGGEWSCGYRNIQMLCHTLINIPAYRDTLFNGSGDVPDVHGIQAWIEQAWGAGFDTEGCLQLGGSLLGSSKWIGATECAALLRYMRVRCSIVDFCDSFTVSTGSSTSTSGRSTRQKKRKSRGCESSTPRPLVDWVYAYFNSPHPLKAWTTDLSTNYPTGSDEQNAADPFIPPLYFQHHGHSRTLVGYEKRVGKSSLFIFDPNAHGTSLKSKLEEDKGWQVMVKRGGHTLRNSEYQIVYVSPGIVTDNAEYERSKILTSEGFQMR
mmetsp:Transcript_4892/g.7454  ORF Transcript_4892/g.7454 Transcript_4892/m.7454 type:complete len:444 (+) Transcript_4892:44-1375(+)